MITSPDKAIKNAIGYMSKNRDTEALILNYSIADNICLPSLGKLSKGAFIKPKDEKKLADKWSQELAIKMRGTEQYCSQLSGGNKQKVVFGKLIGSGRGVFGFRNTEGNYVSQHLHRFTDHRYTACYSDRS